MWGWELYVQLRAAWEPPHGHALRSSMVKEGKVRSLHATGFADSKMLRCLLRPAQTLMRATLLHVQYSALHRKHRYPQSQLAALSATRY